MFSKRALKILIVLCVVLGVLWALYLYRQIPRRQTPFKTAGQAAVIILKRGTARVELRRKDKEWSVANGSASYATDPERVKTLVSGLENLQIEDKISERADRAAEFGVTSASGTEVSASDAGGRSLGDGLFGKQASDFVHIYFRYPSRPDVYLARGILSGDLGEPAAAYWRSRALVTIPEAEVQAITIRGKGFTTALARSSNTWTLDGSPIDPAPVYSLVGSLCHLQADDFVDLASSPALAPASLTYAHIALQGTHQSASLSIGAEDKAAKRYPVAADPGGAVAWVGENKVNLILVKPSAFHPKKP